MRTKKNLVILSFACVSYFGGCWAEKDIYVFSDFGGGNQPLPISDWQTAIELAGEGWKLTNHREIFIHDGAEPLNPRKAGAALAASFPYLSPRTDREINRIVVHVIDPGVGNGSLHPRTLVLRKDGTLFIGPDNGTLSLACPRNSIEAIWEINTRRLCELTGIDLEAGGTFHGRDVFATAAYLLAASKIAPQDIGILYKVPELQFRLKITEMAAPVQFQQISTTRWNIKLGAHPTENELFSAAYFLAIVQSPFAPIGETPQLFFIDDENVKNPIAILNRRTNNLYVGPNNGVGTSFFQGFERQDVLIAPLNSEVYQRIQEAENTQKALNLILKQKPSQMMPSVIDLKASVSRDPAFSLEVNAPRSKEVIVTGRIWLDAYGNIKTTLDSELFFKLRALGYTNLTVHLNEVARVVQFDASFANVSPGIPFIYVGSSGTSGPNPHRTRRYLEISCNGSEGIFGADLFFKDDNPLYNGQEITFQFNIHELK